MGIIAAGGCRVRTGCLIPLLRAEVDRLAAIEIHGGMGHQITVVVTDEDILILRFDFLLHQFVKGREIVIALHGAEERAVQIIDRIDKGTDPLTGGLGDILVGSVEQTARFDVLEVLAVGDIHTVALGLDDLHAVRIGDRQCIAVAHRRVNLGQPLLYRFHIQLAL